MAKQSIKDTPVLVKRFM